MGITQGSHYIFESIIYLFKFRDEEILKFSGSVPVFRFSYSPNTKEYCYSTDNY